VPENYGVWGGLTQDERMGIVKFKESIDTAEIMNTRDVASRIDLTNV
jgi:hypothetical protein